MVEQGTHKPLDAGSNPALATEDPTPGNCRGFCVSLPTCGISKTR